MGNSSSASNTSGNALNGGKVNPKAGGPDLSMGDVLTRKTERVVRGKNLEAVHTQLKGNVRPALSLHEKPQAKPFHEELKKKRPAAASI